MGRRTCHGVEGCRWLAAAAAAAVISICLCSVSVARGNSIARPHCLLCFCKELRQSRIVQLGSHSPRNKKESIGAQGPLGQAYNTTELKVKHEDYSHVYNHTLATILVEYASAVYMSDLTELFTWTCSRCNDRTEGFEMIELIVDVQNCLQAFVGVDENLNSIIIAFRGTQEHSLQNWVEDLFWKQLDLNYPGMPDAMVHLGFYYAYHNTTVRSGILDAVQRAKYLYGDIGIIVTGHSMGGAMASFCALDLSINCKVHDVQLMTFGQPRVGNEAFSSYFYKHVPHTIRVTNRHDMIPHLPPYYPLFPKKTYHHFPREVWIYDFVLGSLVYEVEKICDRSGEDPTCSRSVSGKSIVDHLCYFNVALEADTWGSCKILMNKHLPNLQSDDHGNFVMVKDIPASSVIRLNTEPNTSTSSLTWHTM